MSQLAEVRTDLAIEVRDLLLKETGKEVSGVQVDNEETPIGLVSRVNITTREGAERMGKVPGRYTTIESSALRDRDKAQQEELSKVFAKELSAFLTPLGDEDTILVVGLGNWNATPDALGPRVVHHLLVTRHLFNITPPEKRGGLRPVCAIAPGVLGTTGMETGEIIRGVVDRIKPKCVIAVDALASRSVNRVCGTIQIADTGIHPGSGIGNKRIGITKETLGCDVIAIGVPTVVHAITIVGDALEMLGPNEPGRDVNSQKRDALRQVLNPSMGDMIVTPKEIDVLIDDVSKLLAGGINAAVHPGIDWEEILAYIQ